MRAINHALTGAFIGLVVGEPAVALPAAVASHFICDVIPHYDNVPRYKSPKAYETHKRRWHRTALFRYQLIIDALLCVALVMVLLVWAPQHWLLAAVCAFAAAAPDFLWIRAYRATLQNRAWRPTKFDVFAGRIQWFQRPIGWVVEAAWFIGFVYLLAPFLR